MDNFMEAEWILRQNTPFSHKRELMTLLEESRPKVHGSILDTLYRQINSVRKIDFGEIDKSKGNAISLSFAGDIDITMKNLDLLGKCAKDLETIQKAWSNIKNLSKSFIEGYKLEADIIILTYESMVMAIVDGLSSLITRTASSVVKTKEKGSNVSINVLGRFNVAVKKGTVAKMLKEVANNAIANKGGKSVSKEDFGLTAFGIMAAVTLAIIPLIRELIFYFYYTRMDLAKYLDQLKVYIKTNEVEIKNNSNFDAAKKKDIIDKQNKWIEKLETLSDKIRVNQAIGEKSSKSELKKNNSELTLDNVKDDISSSDGFEFE